MNTGLLYHDRQSPIHRLPPHVKVSALLVFMLVVVATPSAYPAVFGIYAAAIIGVIMVARLPVRHLLPRMVVELPFVVFALILPFIAQGPRTVFWGMSVSESGLVSAWTLLVKGTLGVLSGLTLAATTRPDELIRGLERLRLPSLLVQIAGFMIRYLSIVADDLRRQRVALASRGFVARNPRHWPVLARSAGSLFIRSFERGERVHIAMLSRGYTGKMPAP